jgi:hypothetical protein
MPKVDTTLFDQVLVIDGGSTDGTIEWSKQQGCMKSMYSNNVVCVRFISKNSAARGDIYITHRWHCPDILPDLVNELKMAATWLSCPAIWEWKRG